MIEVDHSNDDQLDSDNETVRSVDYEVGYGKPPRSTQFKEGQSGNRKGRPKARTDLSALLAEGLDERIRTSNGSAEKNVSKQRAILIALVNCALKGDQKALRSLTKLAGRTGNLEPIPDYREHIPVVTMTHAEMKEYSQYPERRDQLIEQAQEREFQRREETREAMRRFNRAHGYSNS